MHRRLHPWPADAGDLRNRRRIARDIRDDAFRQCRLLARRKRARHRLQPDRRAGPRFQDQVADIAAPPPPPIPTPVPLPASFPLVAAGLAALGLAGLRCRRR
jgi:hypothetical protein